MTLFEFVAILALLAGAAWGGYGAVAAGPWGVLRGALSGAGKAVAVYAIAMFGILAALRLGFVYRPSFPPCRKSRCRERDYRYLYLHHPAPPEGQAIEQKYDGKLVQCACGDRYIRSGRESRFYEVRADGGVVPFMKYSYAGRWKMDEANDVERA